MTSLTIRIDMTLAITSSRFFCQPDCVWAVGLGGGVCSCPSCSSTVTVSV